MRQLKILKSITNRESASLDKYLQEIGHEELPTTDQEVELAQRIRKRGQESPGEIDQSQPEIRGICCQAISESGDSAYPTLSTKETLGLSKLQKNLMRHAASSSSRMPFGGSDRAFCRL